MAGSLSLFFIRFSVHLLYFFDPKISLWFARFQMWWLYCCVAVGLFFVWNWENLEVGLVGSLQQETCRRRRLGGGDVRISSSVFCLLVGFGEAEFSSPKCCFFPTYSFNVFLIFLPVHDVERTAHQPRYSMNNTPTSFSRTPSLSY